MSDFEDALDEYNAAVHAEFVAEGNGTLSKAIMDRRDAATRRLHQVADPWTTCRCRVCEP